jgi:hypothetical protein
MKTMCAIYRKELKAYFDSPIAYIFIVVFLTVSSWLFFRTFFLVKMSTMRGFFVIIPWLCMFFIPAVSMRLWAEERKTGSNELLMSLPVQEWEVVLGKYFAALTVYVTTIILTVPLAIAVGIIGTPDWGVIYRLHPFGRGHSRHRHIRQLTNIEPNRGVHPGRHQRGHPDRHRAAALYDVPPGAADRPRPLRGMAGAGQPLRQHLSRRYRQQGHHLLPAAGGAAALPYGEIHSSEQGGLNEKRA